jgi:hypothetical protein
MFEHGFLMGCAMHAQKSGGRGGCATIAALCARLRFRVEDSRQSAAGSLQEAEAPDTETAACRLATALGVEDIANLLGQRSW